jgi:hypothetical protein
LPLGTLNSFASRQELPTSRHAQEVPVFRLPPAILFEDGGGDEGGG